MPWAVERGHGCPEGRPWAVVKHDGEVEGCHATEAGARAQQRALYATEEGAARWEALVDGVDFATDDEDEDEPPPVILPPGERVDVDEATIREWEERVAAVVAAMARRWRRRIARRLAAAGRTDEGLIGGVPDPAEWAELMEESLRPVLLAAAGDAFDRAVAAAERAGRDVAGEIEARDVIVAGVVAVLIRSFAATGARVSSRVAEAAGAAQVAGGTAAQVVRDLGLRGEAPGPLSTPVARNLGANAGRAALAAAAYEVASRHEGTKTWRCLFVRSRETHIKAHGQTVPTDGFFVVGGHTARFPHDPNLPADELCNCRCWATYVIAEAAQATPLAASGARQEMAADAGQRRRGIMVSVEPTDEQRAALALPASEGGVPPEELHVTLGYFGGVDELEDGEAVACRDAISEAVAVTAEWGAPLDGSITGVTTLGDDDPPAQVGLVDAVGLGELRAGLVAALREKGADEWLRTNHDFLAHLTLAYRDAPLDESVTGAPLRFDALWLHFGEEPAERFPLAGPRAVGGADVHSTVDEEAEMSTTELARKLVAAAVAEHDADADALLAELAETFEALGLPTIEVEDEDGEVVIEEEGPESDEDGEDEDEAPVGRRPEWRGPILPLNHLSGDRRIVAADGVTWRNVAEATLPLMLQTVNAAGHDGAEHAGRITSLEVRDGFVWAEGAYADSPAGQKARELVESEQMRGVSVDMDDCMSVIAELGSIPGVELGDDADESMPVELIVQSRIMGVTLLPFPAFQEAFIAPVEKEALALAASGGVVEGRVFRSVMGARLEPVTDAPAASVGALVASAAVVAAPDAAPGAWFEPSKMDEPWGFTVEDDGRVHGLVLEWATAHIGFPGRNVYAPRTDDFRRFYGGRRYVTAAGTQVPVGPLVMDTVHPDLALSASDAQAFYAHTGSIVAAIRLHVNRWGIEATGALLPGVTPDQVTRLRLADVSPDWRPVDGQSKVCAVLAVPLSGFPGLALAASGGGVETLRPRALLGRDGELLAMVAVGAVRRARPLSLEVLEERVVRVESHLRGARARAAAGVFGLAPSSRRDRAAAALERLGL